MSVAAKIGLSLLGIGAVFGIAHVAMAEPAREVLPEALQAKVTRVLQSADPDAMRALATSLRSQGYSGQAKSLEDAADEIERAIKSAQPAGAVPKLRGKVSRAVTSTGLLMPGRKEINHKSLAGQVALAFTDVQPGNEGPTNQELLRKYQRQETSRGFYKGNIDGLYGPKSALSLADDQGIVPPKPLYWPKTNVAASKAGYVAKLESKANADPQRAEEWRQAAQV
jgi:hypothetical protein